jgi:hypothetical protein
MGYTQLGSREYKVMLERTEFGPAATLEAYARRFWSDVVAQPVPGDSTGITIGDELELPDDPDWRRTTAPDGRRVEFFDDEDGSLRDAEYVLRRRGTGDDMKLTLKRRSADRVLASSKQIDRREANWNRPKRTKKVKQKFEEDIKIADDSSGRNRFRQRSLYGLSIDLEGRGVEHVPLESVAEVGDIFPGFQSAIGLPGDTGLTQLREPIAEHVLKVDSVLEFLRGDEDDTSAALVAWYADRSDEPCVIEFSFKHKDDEPDFGAGVARRCRLLLMTLDRLGGWRPDVDDRITKTAWTYQHSRLEPGRPVGVGRHAAE